MCCALAHKASNMTYTRSRRRLLRPTAVRAARALFAGALASWSTPLQPRHLISIPSTKWQRHSPRSLRKAPPVALPKALKDMTYDQIRDVASIRRIRGARGAAVRAAVLSCRRPIIDQTVKIHEIVDGTAREIPFDPDAFDYGKNSIARAQMRKLGYAGFRAHYALNTPRYKDEVVVFLGPSYFLSIGQGQRYGTSARGLAIDTAEPGGEEFPRFEQFWILRPSRNA
jgi:glucans biosynthesis protein